MTTQTNRAWIVGDVAYIDVSTVSYPYAVALVDAADLDRVVDGRGRWRAKPSGRGDILYAWRWQGPRASREYVFLHRFVLGLVKGDGVIVDHANHDGLDDRRSNLRVATAAQNGTNTRQIGAGFRGIRQRPGGAWHAHIRVNGGQRHLGSFATAEAAARAYDAAARETYGDFAVTNFSTDRRAA